MKIPAWIWIIGGILLAAKAGQMIYQNILTKFLPTWEGFSATPFWDYKQWTWGYGTRVPGSSNDPLKKPLGTITRAQAMTDALRKVQQDYLYLKGLINVPLNSNQWAALLSFSYNLGPGNADNLVKNINSQNSAALEQQWKLYINAGGAPNNGLIARRNAEWQLWNSQL